MRDGKSSENKKNKKKLSSDAIAVDISCLAKKSLNLINKDPEIHRLIH